KDRDQQVGVEAPLRVGGDFEIDVGYELLGVGEPVPEKGAGLQMMVVFDAPSGLEARLTRLEKPLPPGAVMPRRRLQVPVPPPGGLRLPPARAIGIPGRPFQHVMANGQTFGAARISTGADGKENLEVLNFRALEPRGRLKLKRAGTTAEYWVVDGLSEYHRICTKVVGDHDVQQVRLFCYGGNRPVAVDVRFTD